jgi:hypothetical protein
MHMADKGRKKSTAKATPQARLPAKPTVKSLSTKLAAMSHTLGRMRMLQKAGLQYGGKRDLFAAAGYIPVGQIKFEDYYGLYRRGDVAGRIVDMAPKTTWRMAPTVVEEDKPDGTKFTKAFESLAKQLKLWRYLERADRLAGIGRYAILVIGVKDVNDQQLQQPMERVRGPEDLIYLATYHEENAQVHTWVTDPGDPRFGMPLIYKVKTTSGIENFRPSGASSELFVHWSRTLHVAEDLLEDEVFGRPRLERPLNRLFDLDKIAASTGEAYWQIVAKILQAKIDAQADVTPTQLAELDEKLLEMVHDLRRQFTGQGVELGWLESTVPTVKDIGDFYFSLIAGGAGIPKRILFGSEMGELASSTDQQTWFGQISERQEQFAEPMLIRAFIDRMILIQALPQPETGEYEVQWPTLFEETDTQKADINLKRAQTAQALTPVGGNPQELVEIDDEGTVILVARDPAEPMPILPEPAPGDEPEPKPGDAGVGPEGTPAPGGPAGGEPE